MRERLPSGLREMLRYAAMPFLLRKLAQEIQTQRTVEEWVNFATRLRVTAGWGPFRVDFSCRSNQIPSEVTRLLELVSSERPRRVLEVGSAGGGTLFLFARVAAWDAVLVGVDLPEHEGGGLSRGRAAIYERGFVSRGQTVRLVLGNSHEDATRKGVERALDTRPVDFLFIDADHTFEGVKRDFEMYAPLVRPGGIIAFHDIMPDSFHSRGIPSTSDSGEVFRFWQELKAQRRDPQSILEFVDRPGQDGFGIGVLRT